VNLGKIHVLLVEDNLVNQKILLKQLSDAGCHVNVANNGVEAVKFLSNSDIWYEPVPECKHLDIILMDWEMPVMDGLTCSREIRCLHEEGKITNYVDIIVVTANSREEQIQRALQSGVVSSSQSPPFFEDG
jgi:CheY-like chemotaxis protein